MSANRHVAWGAFLSVVLVPGAAFAGWGNENWGELVWEATAPPVPGLGRFGVAVLAALLLLTAVAVRLRVPGRAGLLLGIGLLAVPLAAFASSLTLTHTFVNGEVADANQVNANFNDVASAVDDNDLRLGQIESDLTTSLTVNDLAASGDADVAGSVAIGGILSVIGNEDVAGAVTIGSDLTVLGFTDLQAPLSVSGDANVAGTTTSANLVVGTADVQGDLNVGGNQAVAGSAVVGGDLSVLGVTDLQILTTALDAAVQGSLSVVGNEDVAGAATIGSDLTVLGFTDLQAPLSVSGDANVAGTTTSANLVVGTADVQGDLNVGGNQAIAGSSVVGGDLSVVGVTDLQSLTTALDATVQGSVTVVGNLDVGGTLTKAAGTFRIDHPLDPANKTLSHSFVESDEYKNVYDGIVILGEGGRASVELPAWFEALNRDFRYQLTPIGAPAPGLYIAREITDAVLEIAGGAPGLEVSWQVTGVRKDRYVADHPLEVEQDKPLEARGTFLYPEGFAASRSRTGQLASATN